MPATGAGTEGGAAIGAAAGATGSVGVAVVCETPAAGGIGPGVTGGDWRALLWAREGGGASSTGGGENGGASLAACATVGSAEDGPFCTTE